MNMTISNMIDQIYAKNFNTKFRDEQATLTFKPAVNISENESAYLMEFLIPGIDKEKVNIELEEKSLIVSFQPEMENIQDLKYLRKEFNIKGFKRTFTLGDKINPENISATFKNGILSLTLPKKEEAQPVKKVISID